MNEYDDLDPSLWGDPFAYYALALEKQDLPATPNDGLIDNECDDEDDEASCQDKQEAKTMQRASRENQLAPKKRLTKWSYTFPLHKASDSPYVVQGVVYPACPQNTICKLDFQNDFADADAVTEAAESFLKRLQTGRGRVTVEHSAPARAYVTQSHVATGPTHLLDGTPVMPGSWVANVEIDDPALISKVESGLITGFSLGGSGIRVPNDSMIVKSGKRATQLKSLDIDDLSLVGRPASRIKFSVVRKLDSFEKSLRREIGRIEKTIGVRNEMSEFEQTKQEANALLVAMARDAVMKSGGALTLEQGHVRAQEARPDLAEIARAAPGTVFVKQEESQPNPGMCAHCDQFEADDNSCDSDLSPDTCGQSSLTVQKGYAYDERQPLTAEDNEAIARMPGILAKMAARSDPELTEIRAIRDEIMKSDPRITPEQAETDAWHARPDLYDSFQRRHIRSVDPEASPNPYLEQ